MRNGEGKIKPEARERVPPRASTRPARTNGRRQRLEANLLVVSTLVCVGASYAGLWLGLR